MEMLTWDCRKRNGIGEISWNERQQSGRSKEQEEVIANVHGFGALSRRMNCSKPIIAAVNGSAFGGGVELILNCDLIVASQDANFALPEVKRGVIAIQGGTWLTLNLVYIFSVFIFPTFSIFPSSPHRIYGSLKTHTLSCGSGNRMNCRPVAEWFWWSIHYELRMEL